MLSIACKVSISGMTIYLGAFVGLFVGRGLGLGLPGLEVGRGGGGCGTPSHPIVLPLGVPSDNVPPQATYKLCPRC